MLYSHRMPPKVRQNDVTFLFLKFNGVANANTISGLDQKIVDSVEDLGAGNYKINLKSKARRALDIVGAECFTDGLYVRVTASDEESITVICKTFAGVATDASIGLTLVYHGDKTLY